MSRTPVGKPLTPKRRPHYEVEALIGLTAEGEEEWDTLVNRATGIVQEFPSKWAARAQARIYTDQKQQDTRVVKVD